MLQATAAAVVKVRGGDRIESARYAAGLELASQTVDLRIIPPAPEAIESPPGGHSPPGEVMCRYVTPASLKGRGRGTA